MKNEPTKLPMKKILDFLWDGTKVSTREEFNEFLMDSIKMAKELEVEELALIGDAHFDGMEQMKDLFLESMDPSKLLLKTDEYVMEKYATPLPPLETGLEVINPTISGVYPPKHTFNSFFDSGSSTCQSANIIKGKSTVIATAELPLVDSDTLFKRANQLKKHLDSEFTIHAPSINKPTK